jgi:hypothetical protein
MMIRGTETKTNEINVTISMQHMWTTMKLEILKRWGIRPDWDLKPDEWFYEDEQHFHGSLSMKKVQRATPDQIKIYNALEHLEKDAELLSHEVWKGV